MFRIKIHSFTDLITNSSTTIYTFYEKSPEAFKLLVNEMLKVFQQPYKCDDIFIVSVHFETDLYEDAYQHYLKTNNLPSLSKDYKEKMNQITKAISIADLSGNIPEWISYVEKDGMTGYQNYMFIYPKDPKFNKLASLLKNYLYSSYAEEGS
jgi:hypothetical protein